MANTNVNGDDYGLFWNSRGGDREYNGDSFEKWLKKFFYSGVFNGDLQVTATSGMGISVARGYANLDGKVMMFDSATPFTLETASASNPRIDTVVVERNETDRAITLKVVTGTPSASPEPTAPIRTDGVYQLVLAQIYVDTAVASISQVDITDTRPITELCGWVASTVQEIDFDSMIAQYNTWFENFKSHLDGDVAIELQLEIDDLNESMGEVEQIPQNFAPIEATNIASQTYTVGSYLVYNGLLYKVTTAIAQGATLQVGVNIEPTKVGDELVNCWNKVKILGDLITSGKKVNSASGTLYTATKPCRIIIGLLGDGDFNINASATSSNRLFRYNTNVNSFTVELTSETIFQNVLSCNPQTLVGSTIALDLNANDYVTYYGTNYSTIYYRVYELV